ncbi:hypothetical protein LY28_03327 [Ruminiclostridium sufflavum DSM 19573]|uniref:Uncharacterized protein n=1 Tax=Ruminiclostridium sufflavum DSM 19573 TaxID=1121337 RepID=A0A318XGS5_9FIRM|nr:pilus assembly PilX N-terminal domain-containing protein [Ruminiclostridium sufflavum]PYG85639.1 hypothetical protein LY28_03327 [Ruminiclostridium sufflavum DSM 19573]
MRILKYLKKNNGSALTMVLFMLFLLSVVAIAVIALTGSELSMSVMTSDRSKAMLYAQAGAEKAAQIIDEKVAQAQEDARVKSAEKVQAEINKVKQIYMEDADGNKIYYIPKGTLFYNIIDNSDPDDLKIINQEELNNIYENEYKYQLDVQIRANINAAVFSSEAAVAGVNFTYSGFKLKDAEDDSKHLLDSNKYTPSTSVLITSSGEYRSPATGSAYTRNITAEFGLLTGKIPEQIGYMTKVRVNKLDDYPSILSDKALIAQKNIISVDGTAVITGDVTSCGTVPKTIVELQGEAKGKSIKKSIEMIDYSSDSYSFGGIMAGMTASNNNVYNVWDDPNLGMGIKESLGKEDMANILEIDLSTFFTKNHAGSFNITGDAGTLSYLHSLYSFNSEKSEIKVSGNAFARSAVVESQSNYSVTNLQNLFTYDDLRIDGNNSDVVIGGQLVGLNKNIDNIEDNLVIEDGESFPDKIKDIISSAVIVGGDSRLEVVGSVYVGGSSLYSNYYNSQGKFVSGMSIQKSDDRPAAAFEKSGNAEYNNSDTFYFYNNPNYSPIGSDSINFVPYRDPYGKDAYMMDGIKNGDIFDIARRAMHLKQIWDSWKNDVEYASYFNAGDIKITEGGVGKLEGFCYGGAAANDTFYGPYNGFTKNEGEFNNEIKNGMDIYVKIMDLFVDDETELNKPSFPTLPASPKKLKNLYDSVKEDVFASDSLYKLAGTDNFMFYGNENVVLTDESVGSTVMYPFAAAGQGGGIVYAKGDIYVKGGTHFKGTLIAEGNIVFFGGTNKMSYIEYDKSKIEDLIINGDSKIGRFFKCTASDVVMNDDNAVVKTINKKNVKYIKVISWKET